MKKNSKSIISYWMLAAFLAISFVFTSCSWGGSEKENAGDDASQNQEVIKQSTEVTEMEPATVDVVTEEEVFTVTEQMPEYPGGEEALMKYLSENIKYPEKAKEMKIEGKVFVSFVVQKDGKVADVVVLKGIGGGCDEEAVRVVSAMPNWSPGYQKGKPVNVKYTLPISFVLH